jgi:competence ComEA-like helix-hairpin-helix protein
MLNRREQTALVLLTVSLLVGSSVAVLDYCRPGAIEDLRVIPAAVSVPELQAVQARTATGPGEWSLSSGAGAEGDLGAIGPGPGLGPVRLNAASAQELQRLPGIGPKIAARILAFRAAHGDFATIDELQQVPGVGPRTMARLTPLLALGAAVAEVDSSHTDEGQLQSQP